jgi:hypothetical protein
MKKYKIAILDDYENVVAIDGPLINSQDVPNSKERTVITAPLMRSPQWWRSLLVLSPRTSPGRILPWMAE